MEEMTFEQSLDHTVLSSGTALISCSKLIHLYVYVPREPGVPSRERTLS